MKIIGITGTIGAGKGTIVKYLVSKKGFVHYSVRDFLNEEIKKRCLTANRDNMVVVANELRTRHSPYYIIEQLYNRAKESGRENCIIESIRTPGEINFLRKQRNFYLFAIDANPKIRYNRVFVRGSETDHISYKIFADNESREMTSNNPNKQNLSKCIEMADYVFNNDKKISYLYNQVENVLKKIRHC